MDASRGDYRILFSYSFDKNFCRLKWCLKMSRTKRTKSRQGITGSMKLRAWYQTDTGKKREINEDRLHVDIENGLFIVADGMGGHRGGEVASQLAVETIAHYFTCHRGKQSPRDLMSNAYIEASRTIFDHSQHKELGLEGMGTTTVVAYFENRTCYVGNVGDSRAYLCRPPHLWQITDDHSLIYEHIRAGLLPDKSSRNFFGKNVITRSVGFERSVACDFFERKVQSEDHFLLCSDGLTGLLSDYRIADLFLGCPSDQIVGRCIHEANRQGGDDNITAILVQVETA